MNGGETIELGVLDLVLAVGLVLLAGIISALLRLKVEKKLFLAASRTVVQLGLIGLVLKQVFALDSPLLVAAIILVMTVFAAREAVARSKRNYQGIYLDSWLAMTVSCLFVGGIVTQVVVGVEPWYSPRYVIPLLGMILGNSLTGVSLGMDKFLDTLESEKGQIELMTSFGATRREALQGAMAEAVRTGLIPIINAMAAAGIVSLPGMMTGQILAGAPPMQAVAYQIVVMFMIAAADAMGALIAVISASRRIMNKDAVLIRGYGGT